MKKNRESIILQKREKRESIKFSFFLGKRGGRGGRKRWYPFLFLFFT
jgi:hypothetical protein